MSILHNSKLTVTGWQHGSVVNRASVFGWRTFPDLCLICGRDVTTSTSLLSDLTIKTRLNIQS